MTMPVYAVTGASGRLGRLAVEQLPARGVPPSDIVALVRTAAKAISLAASGVQVRQADYSRAATLPAALSGVNRLLLVSGSEIGHLVLQHTNVIEAAKTAGISRIVYTSMLNADDSTSPLASEHRETERVLREAAVPHTVPAVVIGTLPGTVLREVPRSVTWLRNAAAAMARLHAIALTRVPTEIPTWPRLLDRWTPEGPPPALGSAAADVIAELRRRSKAAMW